MNQLTRKQREIADRHQLFLRLARDILNNESYQAVTMERIADLAEYSKGTVYQHFHCKEEILIQLCNQFITDLSALFRRASLFDGNHRERLLAVFFAHDLFAQLQPDNLAIMQSLGGSHITTKVDPSSLAEHRQMEAALLEIVSSIVSDGIACGELALNSELNPVELVFGLWSLSYGGQLIQTYDIPLQDLGIRDAGGALIQTSLAMLDGLHWRPLSTEHDYNKTLERVKLELFADEVQQLATRRSENDGQQATQQKSS